MLRPAMSQIIKKDESNYVFVIEVAKRAREIVNEAEETGAILEEKPVKLAVEEFAAGRPRGNVKSVEE
ncbi:MAG: DNA-directed RNA polymerase subunit omega [Clostridiales bacterium]|nr:DNA-directed RNA polymerase subunit omega [Clostridiales bacterium]